MSRPKFANAHIQTKKVQKQEVEAPIQAEHVKNNSELTRTTDSQSLAEFMQHQMRMKEREATRPITLRFEESLWKQVEQLRGGLSKNDFFKELVAYYVKSQG